MAPASRTPGEVLAGLRNGGPDACWPFRGARKRDGYGHISWRGRRWRAHRLAWEVARGPIPDGLCVLHRCDNRPCCNPDHLFLGTRGDNNRDTAAKGRRRYARNEAHSWAVLTWKRVRCMRALHAMGYGSQQDLAAIFGVSPATVSLIVRGVTWKDNGVTIDFRLAGPLVAMAPAAEKTAKKARRGSK